MCVRFFVSVEMAVVDFCIRCETIVSMKKCRCCACGGDADTNADTDVATVATNLVWMQILATICNR